MPVCRLHSRQAWRSCSRCRRFGVAHAAILVGRIRHVPGRQHGAVPVRRGVAGTAIIGRDHLGLVCDRRAALKTRIGGAHVERKPASWQDCRCCRHPHAWPASCSWAEAPGDVIRAWQDCSRAVVKHRNVGGRERPPPSGCRCCCRRSAARRPAVALRAAADAGVQHGDAREGGVTIGIARDDRRVAHRTSLCCRESACGRPAAWSETSNPWSRGTASSPLSGLLGGLGADTWVGGRPCNAGVEAP
jgi:hypothetical protein